MERLLLLWDEMDEYAGLGRIFVTGAVAGVLGDVASATQHTARHVKVWTSAATGWMTARL
ncbi:MAG: hypothetical protein ABIT36_12690 [Steroidobacteraceae bacterium]